MLTDTLSMIILLLLVYVLLVGLFAMRMTMPYMHSTLQTALSIRYIVLITYTSERV
jgi:hypothetical protein